MNYLNAMRPIVKKAGDFVLAHFRGDLSITIKQGGGIQTIIDQQCEEMLKSELEGLIPGSGFIAEESGALPSDSEFIWVIDPIDGTRNFVRGLPYFAVSVALMHQGQVIAAVTYMPSMGDMVCAQLGHGTWLNGKQIRLSSHRYASAGVYAVVDVSRLRQGDLATKIKGQLKHVEHGVRFRIGGAAAVDLAYAACGSFDLVIFEGLSWWDAAAGVLLVSQAGGLVCQHDGSPVSSSFKTLIAGNKDICDLILPII